MFTNLFHWGRKAVFPLNNIRNMSIKTALIDLSGTLHIEDDATPNAVEALRNVLMAKKEHQLVAIHQGKYYKRSSGLALGPGCFVKGLEYATGSQAVLIGKPNPYFFESAIPQGLKPQECVMIGDDPSDDVMGAMKVGFQGILVKTGKYLPHVVVDPPATALVENFSEAVEWILKNN